MVATREYEDPKMLTQELGKRLDAAGVFLDLSYYPVASDRRLSYANSQQSAFNRAQEMRGGGNYLDPRINNEILNEAFIVEPRAGHVYMSTRLESISGIPYVILSVPVQQEGIVFAVLAAHLDFRPVNQMLAHVAGEGRCIEITSAGRTVAASGIPLPGPWIETQRATNHADWHVVVREPQSTALAPLRRARWQSILWLGAAMVLAVGLSAILSFLLLPPIRKLTRAAQEVARGNLAVRTGIDREDELGILARQFDHMVRSIQELDRLKSDFVSHVSHELRTPLTSAKLSLANLQDEVIGPMQPKQKEVVARIRQDMDRLIHMVNELLDLARLEAGKVELARESLEFSSIVAIATETVRPLAEQKGITLTIEGTSFVLLGDRAKLGRILLNLLDNAVKFTPSGGSVRVTTSGREIAVEDSGPGLPAEPERLFEKFAPRQQPGAPGAGLGLSIARKLVELHGGSIRAENRPTGGARFVVGFP